MREPREFEDPLCAQTGGDFWFPEKGDSRSYEIIYARNICNNCIHQSECAEWGIHNERYGIWGGLTEWDRKQLRRKAPSYPLEEARNCQYPRGRA